MDDKLSEKANEWIRSAPIGRNALSIKKGSVAAIELGRQYDANYANKNPAAMAALYTPDGLLVSPSGPIVRGQEALRIYYTKRFASGARGLAIKVVEVHVQGNGG
jgi:uncharacterized protein (TIGR02246 family)